PGCSESVSKSAQFGELRKPDGRAASGKRVVPSSNPIGRSWCGDVRCGCTVHCLVMFPSGCLRECYLSGYPMVIELPEIYRRANKVPLGLYVVDSDHGPSPKA